MNCNSKVYMFLICLNILFIFYTLTIPSVAHAFNLSTFFGFTISEKKFIVFEKLCNVIDLILR